VAILTDTAPLVAAADRDDRAHGLAARLFRELPGPFVVVTPVLTEAEYFIRRRVGSAAARALVADAVAGALSYHALEGPDLARAQAVLEAHRGLELGLADASIVAVAERLGVATVFTFDHRDFRRVRPAHMEAFDLVPTEADLAELR